MTAIVSAPGPALGTAGSSPTVVPERCPHADQDHHRRAADRVPRRARRPHRVGRRRRRPQPGDRRHPPRGPHRLDRRAARGGGCVRGQRPGPAHRPARRSAWAPSARARSTCSTGSTTRPSRTRRCWRSAGRCRARRWAATSSRRSTTTPCSPTWRCSTRPSTSEDQFPGLIEQAVNAALAEQGVAVLSLPGDVGGLELPKDTPAPHFVDQRPAMVPARRGRARGGGRGRTPPDKVTLLVGHGARHARDGGARAGRPPRRRRWCSPSRPRRASRTTTTSRSASPG